MNQVIISQIDNGYVVVSPAVPTNEQEEAAIATYQKQTGQRPTKQWYCATVAEACDYIKSISA